MMQQISFFVFIPDMKKINKIINILKKYWIRQHNNITEECFFLDELNIQLTLNDFINVFR